MHVAYEGNIPKVSIDSEQIKRALINIIDNAIEAMKQAGEITVDDP